MHFFTPVEVVRGENSCYSPQQLHRFDANFLDELVLPYVSSLADERRQLLHWLRSLPLKRRQWAAAVWDRPFVCLLRKMYQEWESRHESIHFGYQRDQHGLLTLHRQRAFRSNRTQQTALLKEVRLISQAQLYEAVTFSDSLMSDPEALFKLLDELNCGLLHDPAHATAQELTSGKVKLNNELETGRLQCVAGWVAELISRQLSLSFHLRATVPIDELKDQERDYAGLWRTLPIQQKIQLLQRCHLKERTQLLQEYMTGIGVAVQELPSVYILPESQEEWSLSLANCQPKELLSQLLLTSLADSLDVLNMYKMEILLEIEAALSAQKEIPHKKTKKKGKKKIAQLEKDPRKSTIDQKGSKQDPQTMDQKSENEKEIISNGEKNSILDCQNFKGELSLPLSPIKNEQKKEKQQKEQLQKQKIRRQAQESNEEDQFSQRESKIKIQLPICRVQRYFQEVQQKCKEEDRSRRIIFNRLIVVLQQLGAGCLPFGSFAYGSPAPDSDLDIIVGSELLRFFGLNSSPRHRVVSALQFLLHLLQSQPWASNFQLLPAARTPLLKFRADAGIHFQPNRPTKLRINPRKGRIGGQVQVDLTLQPPPDAPQLAHFGLQSTQAMRQWLTNEPLLSPLLIVVKSILRQRGLLVSYEGGLSSLATALLLLAFIRDRHPTSISCLQQFARFLGQLHSQSWIVDLRRNPTVQPSNLPKSVLVSPFDQRDLLVHAHRLSEVAMALLQWTAE